MLLTGKYKSISDFLQSVEKHKIPGLIPRKVPTILRTYEEIFNILKSPYESYKKISIKRGQDIKTQKIVKCLRKSYSKYSQKKIDKAINEMLIIVMEILANSNMPKIIQCHCLVYCYHHLSYLITRCTDEKQQYFRDHLLYLSNRIYDLFPYATYRHDEQENAYRVEQGEIYISSVNKEKIGTDMLHGCIAVVIWNPNNKKAILAHILFKITNLTPLSLALSHIRDSENEPLDLRIIGSRFPKKTKDNTSDMLLKVINQLSDKNISLHQLQVFDPDQVTEFVFDTATSKITHVLPQQQYANKGLITAYSAFCDTFIVSHNKRASALLLCRENIKRIFNMKAKYIESNNHSSSGNDELNDVVWRSIITMMISELEKSIQNVVSAVSQQLDGNFRDVSHSQISQIYLGEDANIHNQYLINHIVKELSDGHDNLGNEIFNYHFPYIEEIDRYYYNNPCESMKAVELHAVCVRNYHIEKC
ncbi:MAG: hypothetical protein P857_873 [Candidatus Xenolissoclinum pacificiensis L6]|uniref:Uncharacterized protein n=1 Tax=Candidatus Xenolissoclinum pacificiensis L6 TaxID=1401685 RepID=W2UZY0_9RICK|nr:MAG: hypothetical protein P857_873 [Candidatus Xenolissoclinum pacificiensis L6]